uniref:hypothetical protein n=1 Tax=Serratia proteamaculans TaxID=28151 RepID=UPI001F4BD5E3|nr:hypothetical protein [Serratia proteamaculans]
MSTQKDRLHMCGHFAQFHNRDAFITALRSDTPVITIGGWRTRYNVALVLPAYDFRT